MSTLSKTYQVATGELKFEFIYSELLGTLDDCEIVDISPLRYGFDSDDAKSIAVYPSSITVTVDDINGDNYSRFMKLYSHYNAVFPFNHYDVLQLVISLNGEIIFKGLLDEVNNQNSDRTVEITFVDGINRYKNAKVGNPAVLNRLYAAGVIPRLPVLGGYAYAFGFNSLQYLTTSSIGQVVNAPGYFPGKIENGDRDVRLSEVIRQLILTLRSDLQVEYQNELKYGEDSTPLANMVGIDQLNIRRVMSNLFGRYVVINKMPGRENQIADVDPSADYQKPDNFEVVYEDENSIVFFHNWSGNYPIGVNEKKWEKGLDEKEISEILKTLAVNTYSYFGLKGINQFFFRHKRYSSGPAELTGIRSMSKYLAIDRVSQVVINDYYTGNYAKKGSDYNIDEEKLEYKIPLNAFRTENGWEYRLNYYSGGSEKRVLHFYDPVLQVRDIPQEYLSIAEYNAHKNHLNRYEFELSGINYNMDSTYRVGQNNYSDLVRPVTIEKYLLDDYTNMTAIQI